MMQITSLNIFEKDILTVNKGIICQAVNCKKVMGRGLALDIRRLYPQVYQAYVSKPSWVLGEVQFVEIGSELIIANMATQLSYGTQVRQTNFDAVETCLKEVRVYSERTGLTAYLPYFVCSGLAGGPNQKSKQNTWKCVSSLIEEIIPEAIICRKP